jgi:hypothetical protein
MNRRALLKAILAAPAMRLVAMPAAPMCLGFRRVVVCVDWSARTPTRAPADMSLDFKINGTDIVITESGWAERTEHG